MTKQQWKELKERIKRINKMQNEINVLRKEVGPIGLKLQEEQDHGQG